jgi:hypothetical protein
MGNTGNTTATRSQVLSGKDSKVVPVHNAMNVYRGLGASSTILDLYTKWWRVVSITPQPLYPGAKRSWYPLHSGMSGFQNRSGRCGEKKILVPMAVIDPLLSSP